MKTFELNNIRKDSEYSNGKLHRHSPVVEVFAAMTEGSSLDRFGKKADHAVNYIKNLGSRAENGDFAAISELNSIRRFVVESPILEEMKMLGIFGTYTNVAFDENVEREVYKENGSLSKIQAGGGDVVFPAISKEVYAVPTFTVSGGYQVDYRRVSLGDMTKENEGMATVRTSILNNAKAEIIKKVYNAITNATGIKYSCALAGLTKSGVDAVLNNVRRNGRPTIVGDYALISQLSPWAGYVGSINSNTITGISDQIINEIAQNGVLSMYNGAIVSELQNPYNEFELNSDGTNYKTLMPVGLGFVIPTGVKSPIATYTRGGLTSLTGNDIKTGKVITRFDLEVGCDVAKGQESRIGIIYDENLGGLD